MCHKSAVKVAQNSWCNKWFAVLLTCTLAIKWSQNSEQQLFLGYKESSKCFIHMN